VVEQNKGTAWKRHSILIVLLAISALLCLLVPPDEAYLEYFEIRTLVVLFSLLAIIAALSRTGILLEISRVFISQNNNLRGLVLSLILSTGIISMIFSNDVALLTILPLTYLVLVEIKRLDLLALLFVLEALAANLLGMITPFGSPQNLFLYSFYQLSIMEFLSVMLLPFVLSGIFLFVITHFLFKEENILLQEKGEINIKKILPYLTLIFIIVLIVLRILPIWSAGAALLGLLFLDKRAFLKLDYGLFLTFVLFFLISGNLSRIDFFASFFIETQENVFLTSLLTSQIISNVPSAILLSQFTDNWPELLAGVNIGGVGTIVASLASLIALYQYRMCRPGETSKFLKVFFALNIPILLLLFIIMQIAFIIF
jgi:Na+/H+ antiporter NhaD/arsenite permease-like protein